MFLLLHKYGAASKFQQSELAENLSWLFKGSMLLVCMQRDRNTHYIPHSNLLCFFFNSVAIVTFLFAATGTLHKKKHGNMLAFLPEQSRLWISAHKCWGSMAKMKKYNNNKSKLMDMSHLKQEFMCLFLDNNKKESLLCWPECNRNLHWYNNDSLSSSFSSTVPHFITARQTLPTLAYCHPHLCQ